MKSLLDIALEWLVNFTIACFPADKKIPLTQWSKYKSAPIEAAHIKAMPWQSATQLAMLNGYGNVRTIDFDDVKDLSIVVKAIRAAGVPEDYFWIARSGSGKGYHLYLRVVDSKYIEDCFGGKKSVYVFKTLNDEAKQVEVRWDSLSIIPPSQGTAGSYAFVRLAGAGTASAIAARAADPANPEANAPLHFIVRANQTPDSGIFEVGAGCFVNIIKSICRVPEPDKQHITETRDSYKLPADNADLMSAADRLHGQIDNYDDYLKVLFGLAALKEAGLPFFLRACGDNPKYKKDTKAFLTKQFKNAVEKHNGIITLRSFYHTANKYGWQMPPGIKRKVVNIQLAGEILKSKYDFMQNQAEGCLMAKLKTEEKYHVLEDWEINTLLDSIFRGEGLRVSKTEMDIMLYSSFSTPFNPILDYFNNLPEWDGVDWIHRFGETVKMKTEADQEFWHYCIKIWWCAFAAGILNDKITNQFMLILQGPPGSGKTIHFSLYLVDEMQPYFYMGNLDPDMKDAKLTVSKNILINFDEMQPFKNDDQSFLRSIMSDNFVEFRRKWGRHELKIIRRSSFVGTVEREQFLLDHSGVRRYLIFPVKEIDNAQGYDMSKIYAQAIHMYKSGHRYYFNREECDQIAKRNRQFMVIGPEEDMLLIHFRPPKPGEKCVWLTPTEILMEIFGGHIPHGQSAVKMGKALSECGFHRKSISSAGSHPLYRYAVVRVPPAAISEIYHPEEA